MSELASNIALGVGVVMLLGVGAVMAMGCLGCTVFLYKEFVKELKR